MRKKLHVHNELVAYYEIEDDILYLHTIDKSNYEYEDYYVDLIQEIENRKFSMVSYLNINV